METANNYLSADQILAAIEHLPLPEMERLTDRVIALQAARKSPHLSADETALLTRINQTLPAADRARLNELIARRDDETVTADEQQELISLTDKLEELHAARLEALSALAQIRGITLSEVINQLGIRSVDQLRFISPLHEV